MRRTRTVATLATTPPLLASKPFLTSPFPLRRRPESLKRNLGLRTVDAKEAARMQRMAHPMFQHARSLILKECPFCRRTRIVPASLKDYFHACCEGEQMVYRGSLGDAQVHVSKLLAVARTHDFDAMRQRDMWHRAPSRATSKAPMLPRKGGRKVR